MKDKGAIQKRRLRSWTREAEILCRVVSTLSDVKALDAAKVQETLVVQPRPPGRSVVHEGPVTRDSVLTFPSDAFVGDYCSSRVV